MNVRYREMSGHETFAALGPLTEADTGSALWQWFQQSDFSPIKVLG